MLSLKCAAQNYEWGRKAEDSEVAKLAQANGNAIDTSKPFAELWMGTHPKCPSCLQDGTPLQTLLEQHPVLLLGDKVVEVFGRQLPFLFKVLSVAKALSIQAHPDKRLAEKLHARAPEIYPDDNHKPEMALALDGGMEALCGFLPLDQLQHHLSVVPELAECVGEEHTRAVLALQQPCKKTLRGAFEALMKADRGQVKTAVKSLVTRVSSSSSSSQEQQQQQQPAEEANGNGNGHSAIGSSVSGSGLSAERVELVQRLAGQFPGDVGVLASLFLNLMHLAPGSAIALCANEPHAYLSGELVECMAASDNVMRAGLTPKPLDVQSLCDALTYEQGLPEVLSGSASGVAGVSLYRPPFEEFEVQRAQAAPGGSVALPASEGPRLMLVQHGAARLTLSDGLGAPTWQKLQAAVPQLVPELSVSRGSLVYVAPGVSVEVTVSSSDNSSDNSCGSREGGRVGLDAWVGAVNSAFFTLQDVRRSAAKAGASAAAAAPAEAAVAAV